MWSKKPDRKSANIILHETDPKTDEIYILVGQSSFICYKALIDYKQKTFEKGLLRELIIDIISGTCYFEDHRLKVKDRSLERQYSNKFKFLGKNFCGILLSGLNLFPGGKEEENDNESIETAYRELCEEFYIDRKSIKDEEAIKQKLRRVCQIKAKTIYSLDLKNLGLSADQIIQEFDKSIKQLGELSPHEVWKKYDDATSCPPFPEMRGIIRVKLDPPNLYEAFCTTDKKYCQNEMGILCDFLCDLAEITDKTQRDTFKTKMNRQMICHHPTGGDYLPAAKMLIDILESQSSLTYSEQNSNQSSSCSKTFSKSEL